MERVTFLLDETHERLPALLNPASVRVRRRSGLRSLDDRPGAVTGRAGSDDPLLVTGGGRTEIELDLVFDLDLVRGTTNPTDVRSLTAPLWALSENRSRAGGPPTLRMVWGTAWNVPAVVEAVTERFERFTDGGAPRRSWLRMRLLRIAEPEQAEMPAIDPSRLPTPPSTPRAPFDDAGGMRFHEVLGAGSAPQDGERLDDIAARQLGDSGFWRHLAILNDITNPPWVAPGTVLRIPPRELLSAPDGDDGNAGADLDSFLARVVDGTVDWVAEAAGTVRAAASRIVEPGDRAAPVPEPVATSAPAPPRPTAPPPPAAAAAAPDADGGAT